MRQSARGLLPLAMYSTSSRRSVIGDSATLLGLDMQWSR
jgi:hypothetical protein